MSPRDQAAERNTNRRHELKTWPEPFLAVACGHKTWEVRRDDRGFMIGDVLVLELWDPSPDEFGPRGYRRKGGGPDRVSLSFRVTYILHGGRFGVPEGYVVMSIEPVGGEADQ